MPNITSTPSASSERRIASEPSMRVIAQTSSKVRCRCAPREALDHRVGESPGVVSPGRGPRRRAAATARSSVRAAERCPSPSARRSDAASSVPVGVRDAEARDLVVVARVRREEAGAASARAGRSRPCAGCPRGARRRRRSRRRGARARRPGRPSRVVAEARQHAAEGQQLDLEAVPAVRLRGDAARPTRARSRRT